MGESTFRPVHGLAQPHLQTFVGNVLRGAPAVSYCRERIETPDGDFLDVDWAAHGNQRLLLLLHGLESSSAAKYVRRMAAAANRRGWDIAALNFRGCSGEPNRFYRAYHSGATDDLRWMVQQIRVSGRYDSLAAAGYSLGGNVLLKYLGEEAEHCHIECGATISVPCDLASSAEVLARRANAPYMRRFIAALRQKLAMKQHLFPAGITMETFRGMRTFRDIDERYTAPAHGFRDAEDYWTRCSGRHFLPLIRRPVLLLQADDDPFLGEGCYTCAEAAASRWVSLEVTRGGGHVGFVGQQKGWLENRVLDFIEECEPDEE